MTAPESVGCTSGAHRKDPGCAHAGRSANASPTYSHSTRSDDRKCGISRYPAPSDQSSDEPQTWKARSAPRSTDGSGATEEITGLAAAGTAAVAETSGTTTRAADSRARTPRGKTIRRY